MVGGCTFFLSYIYIYIYIYIWREREREREFYSQQDLGVDNQEWLDAFEGLRRKLI